MKSIYQIYFFSFFFLISIFFISSAKAATIEATGFGWTGAYASSSAITHATPGLISFNCENFSSTCSGSPNDYNVTVDTVNGTVIGNAWIGIADQAGAHTIGMLRFSDDINDYKYSSLEVLPSSFNITPAHYDPGTGAVTGWARIMSLGFYGNTYGWVKLSGTWGNGSGNYGVTFDDETGKFDGNGWSGNGFDINGVEVLNTGFGIVDFSLSLTEASTLTPAWLQTLKGDIYSGDGVELTAPSGFYNAAYYILSGGGIEAVTARTEQIKEGHFIYFPGTDTTHDVYRSNIGKLDLVSLREKASTAINFSQPLNGGVYLYSGNYPINSPTTILNGAPGMSFGNGTIIIDGNLNINNDLQYYNANVTDTRNMASIAWIITGDLNFSPNVHNAVGSFIVLGENGVSTGEGGEKLTINGLMMAKKFDFERTITQENGVDVPSEKIIYDGRALANTPPGLEDLFSTMPELSFGR